MIQGIADGFRRERFIEVICSGITLFSELGNNSQKTSKGSDNISFNYMLLNIPRNLCSAA